MQFDQLTEGARGVLTMAAVEMSAMHHGAIHCPHVLMGFALRTTALRPIMLRQELGSQKLREAIQYLYPRVDISGPVEHYAPEVTQLINDSIAWVQAETSGMRHMVHPDHLFIKLLASEDKQVAAVLEELGADPAQMLVEAEEVRRQLDELVHNQKPIQWD